MLKSSQRLRGTRRAAAGIADDRVGEVTGEFVGLLAAIAISPQAVLAQTTKMRPLVGWLSFGESDVAAADRGARVIRYSDG